MTKPANTKIKKLRLEDVAIKRDTPFVPVAGFSWLGRRKIMKMFGIKTFSTFEDRVLAGLIQRPEIYKGLMLWKVSEVDPELTAKQTTQDDIELLQAQAESLEKANKLRKLIIKRQKEKQDLDPVLKSIGIYV